MNAIRFVPALAITAFFLLAACPSVQGQDNNVTISKSRLEELERKEAELNKLKGDLNKTKDENADLKKQHDQDAAKIAEAPKVVKYVSPPMTTLPPVAKEAIVDAMDLADHYHSDPAAADQRYLKQTFKVQGEVVGFGSQMFFRPYRIMLKTPDQAIRLTCFVTPPEKYSAVYTIKEGAQLVGTSKRYEDEVVARLGDKVVVEGKCTGLNDSVVHMSGCVLVSAHPKPTPVENH